MYVWPFERIKSKLTSSQGFMSSVDLHTHSGFQCMLAESFAVVCAPKSTPKYATWIVNPLSLLTD